MLATEQRFLQRDEQVADMLSREIRVRHAVMTVSVWFVAYIYAQVRTDQDHEAMQNVGDARRDLSQLKLRLAELETHLASLSGQLVRLSLRVSVCLTLFDQRMYEERLQLQLTEQAAVLQRVKEDTHVTTAVVDAKLLDMKQEVKFAESRIKEQVDRRMDDTRYALMRLRSRTLIVSPSCSPERTMSTASLRARSPLRPASVAMLSSGAAAGAMTDSPARQGMHSSEQCLWVCD